MQEHLIWIIIFAETSVDICVLSVGCGVSVDVHYWINLWLLSQSKMEEANSLTQTVNVYTESYN